jgi:hypothetical protein
MKDTELLQRIRCKAHAVCSLNVRADDIRELSCELYHASLREEVREYRGSAGRGAFAWFTDNCGSLVTKGRFSQYTTYGRWVDAAERLHNPDLVASEFEARTLQRAFNRTEIKSPLNFLSTMTRADVVALVQAAVKRAKGRPPAN